MSSEIDSSDSVSTGRGRQPSPKRRSQRQIDRQEMEQLKKIRAENEELLKKEKEEILKQASPAKEPEPVEEPPPLPPVEENVPESTPQPLSRLAVIRQELQQKIQSVEPVKAKVKTPLSSQPPTPLKVETKTAQSPQKDSSPRVTSSGGVGRPRRENRQPPKHLREAFTQIEFEGIEKLVKRTSVRVSSPDNSFQEEQPLDPPSPKKADQSKDGLPLTNLHISIHNN